MNELIVFFKDIAERFISGDFTWLEVMQLYIPFVLFLEAPLYAFVLLGIGIYIYQKNTRKIPYIYPKVSCIVTCYNEGQAVEKTIITLCEQIYPGEIEILLFVDGAIINQETLNAANAMQEKMGIYRQRQLFVYPKWQRGGRVSSLNSGLALASGSIVMSLDGDTSFDNDMVIHAVRHFADPNVIAVSGALRVRNAMHNLVTRFQGLEYLISIHAARAGLSVFNQVNNISGAFGVFRTEYLRAIGGWDSGTAEDLDVTLRINSYFGRNDQLRIVFEPYAIGHTDAPESWRVLFRQRMRWDGDLVYIYLRKHLAAFTFRQMGVIPTLFRMLSGLMFGITMPILIISYLAWMAFTIPLAQTAIIFFIAWVFYTLVTLAFYLSFLFFISERPKLDLKYLPLVPLFTIYTMLIRIVNAYAVIWSLVAKSHLDSGMAPWWVLRKGKF